MAGTSCQVCGKWPSSRAINRQPCRYCPRPSLNVLAQSGVISPVAQNQRTLHHDIIYIDMLTICSVHLYNLAVSDQVLQRLEDAKQKTRGQCSILKELASYSTTAFGLCYTDLNMSATSRQLDIWSKIEVWYAKPRLVFTPKFCGRVSTQRDREGEMVRAFPTSNPYFT